MFGRAGFIAGDKSCAVTNGFAVLIAPPGMAVAPAADVAARGEPAIEIEFAGRMRVPIPAAIPAELAAAVVKVLTRR